MVNCARVLTLVSITDAMKSSQFNPDSEVENCRVWRSAAGRAPSPGAAPKALGVRQPSRETFFRRAVCHVAVAEDGQTPTSTKTKVLLASNARSDIIAAFVNNPQTQPNTTFA